MPGEYWWLESRIRAFSLDSSDLVLSFAWNYRTDRGKAILAFQYSGDGSERSPDDVLKNFVIGTREAMVLHESDSFVFKSSGKISVLLKNGQNVGVVFKKDPDTNFFEIIRIVINL